MFICRPICLSATGRRVYFQNATHLKKQSCLVLSFVFYCKFVAFSTCTDSEWKSQWGIKLSDMLQAAVTTQSRYKFKTWWITALEQPRPCVKTVKYFSLFSVSISYSLQFTDYYWWSFQVIYFRPQLHTNIETKLVLDLLNVFFTVFVLQVEKPSVFCRSAL